MTPTELEKIPFEAIIAERARRSLSYFVRSSWHVLEPETPMLWNWHIEMVADHIQVMLEDWANRQRNPRHFQRAQNLLINVPPGTGKSRILSVCAPAWAWLHWPGWRVLCLSGNPDVAIRDSVYCRELICSDWYQEIFRPKWQLAEDQNAKGKFKNTRGGERAARGMTAKITGSRADALFVDDPNDAKQIYSETHRREVTTSWDNAIWNRVNDPRTSIRIGIMQRLHEDDWAGHILGRNPGMRRWAHLCLPMEFEPGRIFWNPLGFRDPRTREGELLHSERFPQEVLQVEKSVLGSLGYAGQYQQRPAPAEGAFFKRADWRFWGDPSRPGRRPPGCTDEPAEKLPERLDWTVISVDAAFKKREDGSRVSIQVFGAKGALRYLLENVTAPMSFTETLATLREICQRYRAQRVLIEDKANGSAIIDVLRTEMPGVVAVNPEGGKEARAAAVQPAVEARQVYLADGAPWLDSFVDELGTFPAGRHDDQVDSFSQALTYMAAGSDVARLRMLCTW